MYSMLFAREIRIKNQTKFFPFKLQAALETVRCEELQLELSATLKSRPSTRREQSSHIHSTGNLIATNSHIFYSMFARKHCGQLKTRIFRIIPKCSAYKMYEKFVIINTRQTVFIQTP